MSYKIRKGKTEYITTTKIIKNWEQAYNTIPAGSYRDKDDGDITLVTDAHGREFKFEWDRYATPNPVRGK